MDSAFPDEERVLDPGPAPNRPPHRAQRGIPFNLGKLQIAGIILVFVFIWCVVSALVISMFEIHMLALTEFEDDGKGDVSGFITDENGISLENVTVAIHGTQHFTRTNLEGYYSMEDVKEGDYEIEASLNGYGAVIKRVSIDAHIPALVDFVLEEGGFDKIANERYGSNLSDLRGGILAFFQRFYWIAMFGALCGTVSGVLSIGIIIASILSIIALILIVGNQEEFITSETSFIDRIFGTRRVETRARGGPRARAQKLKAYGAPAKPESKAIPSYAEEEYVPSKPLPMGEIEPEPQRISEEIEKPSPTCVACGGLIKAESQGVQCQCGAYYHRFCAGSISKCKNCDAPL
jgi:hypothetical protein